MPPTFTPIVVGVGDIKNRSLSVSDAIEPLHLMLQATSAALKDTLLSPSAQEKLRSSIDHVGVVNTWTWSYPDLPGLIAEKLGAKDGYRVLSHHGGDSPAKLFDEAARRISSGESNVAIVTGGEALASCKLSSPTLRVLLIHVVKVSACVAAKKMPPPRWTESSGFGVSVSDVTRLGDSTFF
jgi:acetyl-CoA acetyltransferase